MGIYHCYQSITPTGGDPRCSNCSTRRSGQMPKRDNGAQEAIAQKFVGRSEFLNSPWDHSNRSD
jgi:hypothetical protein